MLHSLLIDASLPMPDLIAPLTGIAASAIVAGLARRRRNLFIATALATITGIVLMYAIWFGMFAWIFRNGY